MNKKLIVTAVSVVCILMLIGGSMSFYTTTGKAKNAVSASTLDIEAVMLEEKDGTEKPVTGSVALLPGETKSRIAVVRNTEKEEAFVRVKVSAVIRGDEMDLADYEWITLEGLNNTDWEYSDGYFYYGKPLSPGETTAKLFTGVTLSENADNDVSGQEINLKVQAEGTQVKHNGSSAKDAKGWPEN